MGVDVARTLGRRGAGKILWREVPVTARMVTPKVPAEVVVQLHWADGTTRRCRAEAVLWAYPGDDFPAVYCELVDPRSGEPVGGWVHGGDVRRP